MLIFNVGTSRAFLRASIPALLISAAYDAAAQTSTEDKALPPIVVTASRIAQPQADALPHTTVISMEDIRNSQARDLPTLLRREAGIEITQSGGPGQPASLFMRGAQPNETLILIDGIPVRRQGFAAAPAIEHILPDQIDHIEIVRGNVSAIYGSGAIGGVVQIFTKQGTGKPAFSTSAELGSRGTRDLTAGISGRAGNTSYALSATNFRTDGISAMNTTQFPNENPDSDYYRNTSIGASVVHEWSRGNEFGARLYANDGKYGFDGGGFGSPTDINTGRSKQQSVSVFSKNRFADNWLSTATASQTGTRSHSTSISKYPYDVSDNSDTTLLQWVNTINLASGWDATAGLDAAWENADTSSTTAQNSFSRSTSSQYAGVNGKIGMHEIQANVRYDSVGGAGSETTGYLGYGFAVSPSMKLIASASTAFNAPTLLQLFDKIYGNPSLQPERSHSYELGAQYARGTSIVRATLFKTRTKNQFSIDPNNYSTINLAQASNSGLELSASGELVGTDLRASLTIQDPKNDITDATLIRRARTLAGFWASRGFGPWRIGGDLQYAGRRPDGTKTLDAYWLANLNVGYAVNKQLSLFGRIDNLFNRDYQTAYGYNQPPRGIFAGLSWQY